jgi:translation initiation factor IF-2
MNPPLSPNAPSSGSGSGFSPFRPGINRPGAQPQRPMRSRFPKPAPFLRSNPTQPLSPNTPRIVPATPAPVAGAPVERPRLPNEGMAPRPPQAGSRPGGQRPGGSGRGGKPMRGGKRGGPGNDLPNVRMHTFKNKPPHLHIAH